MFLLVIAIINNSTSFFITFEKLLLLAYKKAIVLEH